MTTGRAKFGIFGDGKEVPQLALARAFAAGDWKAGYYRDQTLMLAASMGSLRTFFALLYAIPDTREEPGSGGRQMANHFATRFLDDAGQFIRTIDQLNSSADVSPVATWMPRALGLAYASKLYRANPSLAAAASAHTADGNEVTFANIGDSSTSEGGFWETMNAAAVLQVPLVVSVWDDGYGISVPTQEQTARGSISRALSGFAGADGDPGLTIHVVAGWDYVALCDTYQITVAAVRRDHVPALVHVVELTQPLGHSTSGSHERYKSSDRLAWERERDCLVQMRAWMESAGLATAAQLDAWAAEDRDHVEAERAAAWETRLAPILAERDSMVTVLRAAAVEASDPQLAAAAETLASTSEPSRSTIDSLATQASWLLRGDAGENASALRRAVRGYHDRNADTYRSHLVSASAESPRHVVAEEPRYAAAPELVDGRLVLRRCFDENLARDPRIAVWGEDVGVLGDVNLVFEGLQSEHGKLRVSDTGIREASIVGQAIGAAMRGLRPIADIQYLDYMLCALQIASDDLASLHWRTAGGQKAPVIIRTKGHRFQGVWHAGSPMGMLVHALRGVHLAVPRDCTRAAGLYNTFLRGDDPALVVEVLNAYRLKESMPINVGTMTIPLGQPECLRSGRDLTLVTYGACCRVALAAASIAARMDLEIEVIDVQTLLPFDVDHQIGASVKRTGAVLFVDEDVPGGASAYMMQKVLEEQSAWWALDATPRTVTAPETRSGFGVDGDFYGKPGVDDIIKVAYEMAHERDPRRYASLV